MATITAVGAREVLDSRGWPTVEADVTLSDGAQAFASVPSGASRGGSEACELRDDDPTRYGGRGVRQAVANVVDILGPAVVGRQAADQAGLDAVLLELDGTPDKSRLGANAILAVSCAGARAAAFSRGLPLWRHLAETLFDFAQPCLPLPMINILSGGHHAGFQLDLQDVLLVPVGADSVAQALEWTNAVYYAVRRRLQRDHGYRQLVADEGGFGPDLADNEAMLAIVTDGIVDAGLEPGSQAALAVDVAATHFWRDGAYRLAADDVERDAAAMTELLAAWVERYPIVSLEDGLADEDWAGWPGLTRRLGDRVQLLGDDLFTTNPQRLARGIKCGCANSVLVKMNQIGTLTETAAAWRLARAAGYSGVVSARSGETEDDFLADLAAASGAGQIKVGAIARSERLAKYNRLLRLAEHGLPWPGAAALGRWR